MRRVYFFVFAFAALCAVAPAIIGLRYRVVAVGDVPTSVIGPVLAQDWPIVARVTAGPCCGQAPSSAIKMIHAHALLATNHNTEASCILLSATDRDLEAWSGWTDKLAQRYPGEPAALYLRADALARRERFAESIAEYSKALERSPGNALALNGRGQVYAARSHWDHAIGDLEDAAKANPRLADAFANRGWVFIARKSGASGAVDWFTRALGIAPDFAMARHGLGGAEIVLRRTEDGKKDFADPVTRHLCVAALAQDDIVGVAAYLHGMSRDELAASLRGDNPGMSTNKKFTENLNTFLNRPSNDPNKQSDFAHLRDTYHNLPSGTQQFYGSMMSRMMDKNPRFREEMQIGARNSDLSLRAMDALNHTNDGAIHNLNNAFGNTKVGLLGKLGGETIRIIGNGLLDQSLRESRSGLRELSNNIRQMNAPLTRPDPGGVKVNLDGAELDDGSWPFSPYYGLLYHVTEKPESEGIK